LWPDFDVATCTRAVYWPHAEHRSVPRLSAQACGGPKDWNKPDTLPKSHPQHALFWSKDAVTRRLNLPSNEEQREVDLNVIIAFLQSRLGLVGEEISSSLRPPIRLYNGWVRFPVQHLTDTAWPGYQREPYGHGWERAWHGCKLEGVFSMLHEGRLRKSGDDGRTLGGVQGVYVHQDNTAAKAENYMRWTPLCGDGVFWAAKWEVRVKLDTKLATGTKTDQWVFPEHGVQLVALWVCGRTPDEMVRGVPVSREWVPSLEARPSNLPTRPQQQLPAPPRPRVVDDDDL